MLRLVTEKMQKEIKRKKIWIFAFGLEKTYGSDSTECNTNNFRENDSLIFSAFHTNRTENWSSEQVNFQIYIHDIRKIEEIA